MRKYTIATAVALCSFLTGSSAETGSPMIHHTLLTDTIPTWDSTKVAPPDDKIFEMVEFEATFPGNIEGWRTFLEANLNADVPAKRKAPPGNYTVIVQFIVDKTGRVSDINPLTAHGFGMEAEVVRVMRRSPRWTPAVQNGRPVKAYRKQPITFAITKE